MQQWGAIAAIDGPVLLFTPTAVDPGTRELIRSAGVVTPNHWPSAALARSAAGPVLDALHGSGAVPDELPGTGLRDAARVRLLCAALLLLMTAVPAGGGRHARPTREAFIWFREELEVAFRARHQVADYAARLGYSTRTLNRLARENTGLSAKQMIDERIVLEAKRLLAHGRDPVARIADQLGFDDASNFSKYFQQRAGVTPMAFRERTRTGVS
ncbi:helix-turn-helix domain-containing protein [Nocardia sp. IFM 10818]